MNYKLKNTLVEATVEQVKRAKNSTNGNPCYELVTDLGSYKTAANAGWVYGVNFSALEGKKVLMTLNGRGSITKLEGEF